MLVRPRRRTVELQSFLPLPSFEKSARVLDVKRLAAMRKESCQLALALSPYCPVGIPETIARKQAEFLAGAVPKRGWSNHAAAKMWRGRLPALLHYLMVVDLEWKKRGYKSNLVIPDMGPLILPSWVGDDRFHSSHRSALLRKLPSHYEQWGWTEPPDLEYVWPGPCANLPADPAAPPLLRQP